MLSPPVASINDSLGATTATLDLWPVDVACKLVCGINPNERRRREDIENPDTLTRPAWVNLFHKAQAAILSGKLRVQTGCVYPAELVVLAQGKGIQIPGGLGRLNLTTDQPSVEAGSSPRRAHNEERDTAIFRTMTELKWSEVSIAFIEPDAVRIKAGEKSETFTYDAMGFRNRSSMNAKPNMVWATLRTLAIVTNTAKTLADTVPPQTDFKRRVSRLRDTLQKVFGIKDDPIPYVGNDYKPAFTLTAEEHVIRGVRDQTVPGDEDEEGIEATP